MAETTAGGVYQHRLKTRSVGFPGVLMQSVAQISPTLGIFYTIAFTTGQAGRAAPPWPAGGCLWSTTPPFLSAGREEPVRTRTTR